jgi:hypothetical protein
MPRSRSLTSQLYRFARNVNTISTVASGNPKRIATRGKNIVLGRVFAKAGVWRRLWR